MNYEITLTLHPGFVRRRTALDQHQVAKECLLTLFKTPGSSFEKVSLIAELTQVNNVHYHGIIFLQDHCHRDKVINRIRARDAILGRRFTITQLVNYPTWCEYMNKSTKVTRDIIGDPIVVDDFNVYSDPQYRFMEG